METFFWIVCNRIECLFPSHFGFSLFHLLCNFIERSSIIFNYLFIIGCSSVCLTTNVIIEIPICWKAIKIIVKMQPNKYQWMRRQFLNTSVHTIQWQCIRKQLWMKTKKIYHQIGEKQSGIWVNAQPNPSIWYDFHPYIELFYKVKFHRRT